MNESSIGRKAVFIIGKLQKLKPFGIYFIIFLLLTIFILDLYTPHGLIIDWMLYVFPLLIGFYILSDKALIPLVSVISALMVINLFTPQKTYIPFDFSVMNRISGMIVFIILTLFMREQKRIKINITLLNKELEKKVYTQNLDLLESNMNLQNINEELEKSKNLYLTTVNSFKACVYYIDRDYRFVLVNDAYIRLNETLGFETKLVGKNINVVSGFIDKSFLKDYEKIFNNGIDIIREEEKVFGNKVFNFDIIKTPLFENGNVLGIVTILRDITMVKDLEKKLLLVAMEVEEKQKKIFSEDLHEQLGAYLSTMKIYITKILQKNSIDEARELLEILKGMIYEAVDNTKNIVFKMTPHVLVNFGLIKAMEEYCARINSSNNNLITFTAKQTDKRFDKIVEIYVYRILLEFINNSITHSEAKSIKIDLNMIDNKLNIEYSDDGKGFEKNQIIADKDKGMGIRNIYSRVKVLNGKCAIESEIGKGMKATIEIENHN